MPAGAAEPVLVSPEAEALAGVSYADLVAMALPGAALNGENISVGQDVTLPHIEGADFSVPMAAPVAVNEIEAVTLSLDGQPHVALLMELTEGDGSVGPVAGLALFDMASAPKLVDVVDVGFDRLVSFGEPATLAVGGGSDWLLVSNQHGNAGQFYDARTVVDVIGGKLQLVDVVMLLSDQGCAGSRTQSLQYEADGAAPERAPVRISVTDKIEGPQDACEGVEAYEPGETVYAVTYQWDQVAGRYVADGDGWAALDEVNGSRY